jgi:hypothetical protein
MDPETHVEVSPDGGFCPECGVEESGFFCRSCGTLLRDGEMVLCPRCRHVVPDGDFCNQCGQSLGSAALNLRQLVLAGDDFWVTAESASLLTPPAGSSEPGLLAPDQSVVLEDAELPDWLQELPVRSVPSEVEARIHPTLRPIETKRGTGQGSTFLITVILLTFVLMLGLVLLSLFVLLRGAG